MENLARSTTWAVILLALTGCFPPRALNPFYTSADLTTDDRLVGIFDEVDSPGDPIRIRRSDEQAEVYLLGAVDPDKHDASFAGRLFGLGGSLYLDIAPNRVLEGGDADFFAPLHWVCRVTFVADGMELKCLDEEWLRERIAAGTAEPMAMLVDDEIILTGTTEELQAFVLRHADDPDAFPPWRFRRVDHATEPQR